MAPVVSIQGRKTKGVPEEELVLQASELVDVVLEFRRRLRATREHVVALWSVVSEIERVVQDSRTMDPFTKSTILRLCGRRSTTGIVEIKEQGILVPDGGPEGDPTR